MIHLFRYLGYMLLGAEISAGLVIRLYPVRVLGLGLGDLDPYRYLRLVGSVVEHARLAPYDPLTWPFGHSKALFAANQGYAFLISELTVLSGIPLLSMLSMTPVVSYLFLLMVLYLLTVRISGSNIAGVIMLAFVSLTPSWWLLVNSLATNALAENVAAIFHFLAIYQLLDQDHSIQFSALLAGLFVGITLLIHPVTTYFTLALLAILLIAALARGDLSRGFRGVIGFALGFVPFLIMLWPWWRDMSNYGRSFSEGAKYLTSLAGAYFTLRWDQIVTDEIGILPSILACGGIAYFLMQRKWHYRVAAIAVGFYSSLILASNFHEVRNWLGGELGSGLVLLSHRVVPYFLPWVYILSAVSVTHVLLPAIRRVRTGQSRVLQGILFLIIVAAIASTSPRTLNNSRLYTEFSASPPSPQGSVFTWLSANTRVDDVILANNFTYATMIKALARRPVLFSLSYEDIVESEMEARIAAHYYILSLRADEESVKNFVGRFHVKYVVVFRDYYFIDIQQRGLVGGRFEQAAYGRYIAGLSKRSNLEVVYSDRANGVYVFEVIQ